MGEEKSAMWYDKVYATSKAYTEDPINTGWYSLWKRICSLVNKDDHVLDLGCGPGHLGEMLQGRCAAYTGVDFSSEALAMARTRVPWGVFYENDLRGVQSILYARASIVVLSEVLEHIKDDREILKSIPSGTKIIVTVPNFDCASHVRYFETSDNVIRRYQGLINIYHITTVRHKWYLRKKWYLFEGTTITNEGARICDLLEKILERLPGAILTE